MNTVTLEFSTAQYEFSHGHKPRGYGRWAFKESGGKTEFLAPYSMTLTDAKKWFKQHLIGFEVKGHFQVIICP